MYQIYPRSFCDTSGDGIGDLEGVRRHLDHLWWLGVDAVWLSPFYPSPMADFGYDVADYCDVDPLFGTLADFDRLSAEAHDRGIHVLVDWVPNHTSDQHPWFVASRSSREDPRRDWYWWRDDRPDQAGGSGPPGSLGRLPNDWRAAFPGVGGTEFPPAWTWDDASRQWYLHLFLPEQPDLNWANPAVREAMAETLRRDPGSFGLVSGVGMHMMKHSYGLWSSRPGPMASGLPPATRPRTATSTSGVDSPRGAATVATYSVVHGRDGAPTSALLVCDLAGGGRCYAKLEGGEGAFDEAETTELLGRTVTLTPMDGVNLVRV